MSSKLLKETLVISTALVATVIGLTLSLRQYDLGSLYHVVSVATVGGILIGGTSFGPRRLFFGVMGVWSLMWGIWGAVERESLKEWGSCLSVFWSLTFASATVGKWWTYVFRSARAGTLFAAMTWTPFVTGFFWIPSLFPDSKRILTWALNLHPAAGVISTLKAQKILWSPGLYERLPYAEYGAGFWEVPLHTILWGAVALGFGGASWAVERKQTPLRKVSLRCLTP